MRPMGLIAFYFVFRRAFYLFNLRLLEAHLFCFSGFENILPWGQFFDFFLSLRGNFF